MEFCLYGYWIRKLFTRKKLEIDKKSGGFGAPFLRTIFYYFFSCGFDGVRHNSFEIELGKIPKQNIHSYVKENSIAPCRSGFIVRVHKGNFYLALVGLWQN